MNNPYKAKSLCTVSEIPVFSHFDAYVLNYEKISNDHVSAITKDSQNPWIESDLWEEMEAGTLRHLLDSLGRMKKSLRILDVGVGLGRLLEKVKNCACSDLELYGIDVSLAYLKIARAKGLNVAMAKIEDMPYFPEYFDIVTCTDVLEHVEDLNLCVRKIVGVLKPGGTLIVRVPNREDLSSYLKPEYPYYLAHLRAFDEFGLELLFTRVFDLEFIEKSPGLFIANAPMLKYKLPIKGYNFILTRSLRLIGYLSKPLHRQILRILYHPTEINVVLRKTV